MIFGIPILIQERPPSEGGQQPLFIARPVFHPGPEQKSEKLSRALNKLNSALRNLLEALGEEQRHDELAKWTFNPVLQHKSVAIRLSLKSGEPLKEFFFVQYQALGRTICFTPAIADLSFELLPGQSLEARATEVLNAHLREQEKSGAISTVADLDTSGKFRLSVAEVELSPAAIAKRKKPRLRALLFGGDEPVSGEKELRKVGQSLQQWYPDDLQRSLGRDAELEELARLFSSKDRRPILVVGPPKVGKTALIHELAWQIGHRKKEKFAGARQIWLLSAMRLISGMSYLGEWENRVNAIIKHAAEKDHVLYFEDLLGLFTAGVSAASDLNVAQVLKPHLEKRAVRTLAEITPEALRVLREKDRAFADLFHIVPLEEPCDAEVWRVLIHLARELENEHRCAFDIDVLPLVFELHRRFARDAAFPGKAAGFLRRLAIRHKEGKIARNDAIKEFSAQTGLLTAFVAEPDAAAANSGTRASLLAELRKLLKGQDQALANLADVLVTFRAGLNDPSRPIATLLLLGPTGVGKTESAKALAQILFGSSDRLLRFDLNEFVDARALARLTGSPAEPDGLLTGGVRRQPFSVILFDEIEKAAPEVFDMLLGVLDEGRLVDSLGRVADFTNSIILLSSNLGAREARSRLGFGAAAEAEQDAVFVDAAEKFFRPEFFNRLDRVVPFRALSAAELGEIAHRLLAQIQSRDGLRRRDCTFTLTEAARRRIVELGHHPQLGARALKRTFEREVSQRLAQEIAAAPPSVPIVARLDAGNGGFKLDVLALAPANATVTWARALLDQSAPASAKQIEAIGNFLDRADADLAERAPAGAIEWSRISPADAHYYFCREQFAVVERLLDLLVRPVRRDRAQPVRLKAPPRKFVVKQYDRGDPVGRNLRDRTHAEVTLTDLEAEETREAPDSALLNLYREAALLAAMLAASPETKSVPLQFIDLAKTGCAMALAKLWTEFLAGLWGGSEKKGVVSGPFLNLFLPPDGSSILARSRNTGWAPITIRTSNSAEILHGPIIGRYDPAGAYADARCGLAVPDAAHLSAQDFRALLLSTLPLPEELAKP